MSPIAGNLIVIAVLTIVVFLAVRSIWKERKRGCHCGGDCSRCGGCGHSGAAGK